MTTLYIDCNREFSAEMLLGALMDMGLSPEIFKLLLRDDNIPLEILNSKVTVDGIEAMCAYCKRKGESKEKLEIPEKIKDLFIKSFNISDKSSECIDIICAAGLAICSFFPDYIMCSNIMGETAADREFLSCIINEEGNPPVDAAIMSVGYGAGKKDVLRVVLYGSDEDELTLQELDDICIAIEVLSEPA